MGFVDVFTASFIQHFIPKNMAKIDFSVPVTVFSHLQSDKALSRAQISVLETYLN